MRKIMLGFAALAIAFSALTMAPSSARALDFSITFGTGHPPMVRHHDSYKAYPVTPHTHRPVAPQRRAAPPPRYDHRSNWRDHRRHDRRWHDSRRGASNCTIRTERYWNGRYWVTQESRVCR
ncbi:MAG: hypothetical protein JJU21_01120 [Salinarimonas sp.]|nr:hypothetical protein [Salinarimonas sp.]